MGMHLVKHNMPLIRPPLEHKFFFNVVFLQVQPFNFCLERGLNRVWKGVVGVSGYY